MICCKPASVAIACCCVPPGVPDRVCWQGAVAACCACRVLWLRAFCLPRCHAAFCMPRRTPHSGAVCVMDRVLHRVLHGVLRTVCVAKRGLLCQRAVPRMLRHTLRCMPCSVPHPMLCRVLCSVPHRTCCGPCCTTHSALRAALHAVVHVVLHIPRCVLHCMLCCVLRCMLRCMSHCMAAMAASTAERVGALPLAVHVLKILRCRHNKLYVKASCCCMDLNQLYLHLRRHLRRRRQM